MDRFFFYWGLAINNCFNDRTVPAFSLMLRGLTNCCVCVCVIHCVFLQRATAGLRRTTAELTDASQDNCVSSSDNSVNDDSTPPRPTEPVVMEISSSPPLTDLERENMVSWRDQEVEELHYPECLEIQQSGKDQQKDDMTTAGGEDGERDGDECDYLVFETGVQREEIKMGESEGGQKGTEGEEEEDTDQGGETNRENEIRNEVASENGSGGSPHCETRKSEGEDEWVAKNTSEDKVIEGTKEDAGSGDGKDTDERVEDAKADSLEEFPFLSKSPECHPSPLETSNLLDASKTPAATKLPEDWAEDPAHPDDLSDCLQAELAIVYSDSDAGDDQWAAFSPRDITHQKDNCEAISDSVCDGESKEEERGENNATTLEEEHGTDKKREEEVEKERRESLHRNYDDEEQMRTRREVFLRSPSVSSTASSIDPERRVKHVTSFL